MLSRRYGFLLLATQSVALRFYYDTWPIRERSGNGARISHYHFKEYQSSQTLCSEAYEIWWDEYFVTRSTESLAPYLGSFAVHVPPLPEYQGPPVQSMGSSLGGTGSVNANPLTVRSCQTFCEDTRSDLELWIAIQLEKRPQVRYKGPFNMLCPKGWRAKLFKSDDQREPESGDLKRLTEAILLTYEDNYRFGMFPSYSKYGPRIVGAPVQYCKCISNSRGRRRNPILHGASVSTQSIVQPTEAGLSADELTGCIDIDQIQVLQQDDPAYYEQFQDYPYTEAGRELEDAVAFWSSMYPDPGFTSRVEQIE